MNVGQKAKVDSVAILDGPHAAVLGLPEGEYASMFVTREDGQRLTLIGGDVGWIRLLSSAPADVIEGLVIPPEKFPLIVTGWPEDWGLFDFSDTPGNEPDTGGRAQ